MIESSSPGAGGLEAKKKKKRRSRSKKNVWCDETTTEFEDTRRTFSFQIFFFNLLINSFFPKTVMISCGAPSKPRANRGEPQLRLTSSLPSFSLEYKSYHIMGHYALRRVQKTHKNHTAFQLSYCTHTFMCVCVCTVARPPGIYVIGIRRPGAWCYRVKSRYLYP